MISNEVIHNKELYYLYWSMIHKYALYTENPLYSSPLTLFPLVGPQLLSIELS